MSLTPQTITLDLNPSFTHMQTVYCSQYDDNIRQIVVNMKDGGSDVDVSSYTIYIEGTKPDKKGFSYPLTEIGSVSGHTITFYTQLQMCAVPGMTRVEVVLKSGTDRIGSANFMLAVERAGLQDDTDISETDIPGYIDGAQQAMEQAVAAAETASQAAETATEVAESIPADYTTLSNDVDDLKTAIFDGVLQTDVDPEWVGAYVNTSGVLKRSTASGTAIIPLQKGQTITVGTTNSNICIIGSTTASTLAVGDTITVIQKTTTGTGYEEYSYTAPADMNAVICVALADYEAYISEDTYAKKSIADQTLYGTDDYIDQFNSALLKVYKLKTGNTMTFGWISDSHDKSGFSAANTLNILNKLSQKSGCGFIANTGDIIEGGSTAENNYPYFLNYWKYASQTDLPILYALGHHELYGVNKESGLVSGTDTTGIPRAVIEGTGNGYIKLQNVAFDANNKSNYYVDLPNGYRVIVIDSIYGTNSARGYTSDTMSFVSNNLDSQKVNIILAHVPPLSGLLYPVLSVYNGDAMHNILKLFVANGGTVIYFHGHTHLDYADVIDGVPYIAIACASAHQTTDATYANGYGDAKGWARAKGTYTEFLFDIVTINPNTQTINLTRFGAGEDRSLTY